MNSECGGALTASLSSSPSLLPLSLSFLTWPRSLATGTNPVDVGPGTYSEPDPARTTQEYTVDSPALVAARTRGEH